MCDCARLLAHSIALGMVTALCWLYQPILDDNCEHYKLLVYSNLAMPMPLLSRDCSRSLFPHFKAIVDPRQFDLLEFY